MESNGYFKKNEKWKKNMSFEEKKKNIYIYNNNDNK